VAQPFVREKKTKNTLFNYSFSSVWASDVC